MTGPKDLRWRFRRFTNLGNPKFVAGLHTRFETATGGNVPA